MDRRAEGAQQYLADYITVLKENDWHWAFYAYRGDGAWGGLDYELGTGKLDWRIWDAEERGEDVEIYKKRGDNPLWQVISQEFTKPPRLVPVWERDQRNDYSARPDLEIEARVRRPGRGGHCVQSDTPGRQGRVGTARLR